MWAVSASVGNIIYYLALGDRHPGHEMWTRVLTDRRFLLYSGLTDLYQERPLYDLDFMIEAIFKGTYPIDQNKVKLSDVTFYIAVQSGLALRRSSMTKQCGWVTSSIWMRRP